MHAPHTRPAALGEVKNIEGARVVLNTQHPRVRQAQERTAYEVIAPPWATTGTVSTCDGSMIRSMAERKRWQSAPQLIGPGHIPSSAGRCSSCRPSTLYASACVVTIFDRSFLQVFPAASSTLRSVRQIDRFLERFGLLDGSLDFWVVFLHACVRKTGCAFH